MSQRFVGVDPGLGERAPGGLALISEDGLRTWRMPRGDDVTWLREVVKLAVEQRALIFVERLDTRGSMSVPGAFVFGQAKERGELPFLLAGLTIERIQPAWWKPALGLSKDSTLEQRRARLSELLEQRFDIKPDLSWLTDGEVDAALIACAGALKTAPAVRLAADDAVDVEGGDAAILADI